MACCASRIVCGTLSTANVLEGYPSVPLLAAERTGARSGFGFVLNALHSFVASVRALSCLCPVFVDQA